MRMKENIKINLKVMITLSYDMFPCMHACILPIYYVTTLKIKITLPILYINQMTIFEITVLLGI